MSLFFVIMLLGDYMEKLLNVLKEKKLTISFAESCTGGLLAAELVKYSGASDVFGESVVTYSNEAKVKYLNVQESTLYEYGAVSRETAIEMAKGIKHLAGSDVGVSITGIAGPTGGTMEKPVGLVYIAVSYGNTYAFEHVFDGDRTQVREQAVFEAIMHILEVVS